MLMKYQVSNDYGVVAQFSSLHDALEYAHALRDRVHDAGVCKVRCNDSGLFMPVGVAPYHVMSAIFAETRANATTCGVAWWNENIAPSYSYYGPEGVS